MARSVQPDGDMARRLTFRNLKLWLTSTFVVGPMLPLAAQAQTVGIGALLNPEGSRLFPQPILYPRHPGKPDPRWHAFSWRFVDDTADSTKYRLYFYEEEDWTARFVLPKIHDEVEKLSKTFAFSPPARFNYLLFTSERHFQQANIFDISEGVQGITSTEEATMAIPYWGEQQTFDHISTHEMVHQFQVQKIQKQDQQYARERMQLFPLWFIEGMAEYYSLHGVDNESRVFLRDLSIHPKVDRGYTPPGFFEEGQLGFITTYKCGQAKIDFLEKRFGKGTAQMLLTEGARKLGAERSADFRSLVATKLNVNPEILEAEWKSWFIDNFQKEADTFSQSVTNRKSSFEIVKEAGNTLDLYDISPDGRWLVTRQVDPMTGVSSIQLFDFRHPDLGKTQMIADHEIGALSLYFFRSPTLAVSNWHVGYAVETAHGPAIEIRSIADPKQSRRFPIYQWKILQPQSITFSPDGRNTAFIGVTAEGASNIYVIDNFPFNGNREVRQITHEHYSWRTLSWSKQGILAAGDRTANGKYAIFSINPSTGELHQLTAAATNQATPSDTGDGLILQTWDAGPHGSPQVAILSPGNGTRTLKRITDLKTGATFPRFRNGKLYFLAFEGGRYQLARGTPGNFGTQTIPPARNEAPWEPKLADIPNQDVERYRPFVSSGKRLDNLGAFLASGGYFGFSGSVSDLMRDYSLSADFLMLGEIKRASADVFISSYRGRTKWTLGAYNTVTPQLDSIFPPTDGIIRTYLYREFGALGMAQYPFTVFSYADLELRVGGANRTDYSDPAYSAAWNAENPGTEFIIAPTLRLGYDDILYEAYSGPLKGTGALLEVDSTYTPARGALSERLRLDLAEYWHLPGRTVLALQGLTAAAFGDRYRQSFLVSSDDILRAYPFNDDRLYGNYVVAAKTEFRFPVGQIFDFPPLRGLAAYDLGSVFTDDQDFIEKISSSASLGITFNIPPISMNFMVSYPIREAPGPQNESVGHFTLRYLYL